MTYEDNVKKRATELQAEGKTKEQIAAQLDIETNL
jgi:orotate phosphoribosyltransferase-like protein